MSCSPDPAVSRPLRRATPTRIPAPEVSFRSSSFLWRWPGYFATCLHVATVREGSKPSDFPDCLAFHEWIPCQNPSGISMGPCLMVMLHASRTGETRDASDLALSTTTTFPPHGQRQSIPCDGYCPWPRRFACATPITWCTAWT